MPRRTRLPPRFAVGASGAPGEGFDVPANLGVTPGTPPKVNEVLRHPGIVLNVEIRRRRSWPTALLALGVPAALALAYVASRGRR